MILILRKLKLNPVQELGCGDEGCAYLLDDGRVAKVSTSKWEFGNAQVVMLPQIQAIKMSQKIDLVKNLDTWHDNPTKVTVTVREPLDDVFDEDSDEYWLTSYLTACTEHTPSATKDAIVQGEMSIREFIDEQADCMLEELDFMSKHPPSQIEGISRRALQVAIANVQGFADQLLHGVAEYAEYGIFLKDLQPSNFGVRENGQLVVRDLGCYDLKRMVLGMGDDDA